MKRTFTPLDESVNRERLADLRQLMLDIAKDKRPFDMWVFREGSDCPIEPECGTAACALGYATVLAPKWGVKVPKWKGGKIKFTQFSKMALGIERDTSLWYWLFGSAWVYTDNTAKGAAKRIEIALKKGVPSDEKGQRWGDVPLMYKV